MPVWIERLNVENLGPINEQVYDFDRFNLIYGANETGKTFLVEFLLRSLFRHASKWSLRDLHGHGKVSLRGLDEGITDFTPGSRKKLEDYWEEDETGLPANMAQLLVVKGGELDLSRESPGGVGREVLKTALSRETLLDQILDPIQHTIQNASIKRGEIDADRRGKVKDLKSLADELQKMDRLLERVESNFSQGPIRTLELKLENVQSSLAEQQRAKRYRAYQLQKEKEEWEEKRKKLPDQKIEELRDHIRDHQQTQKTLLDKKEQLQEKEEAGQHYLWLKKAVETWESQDLNRTGQPNRIFMIGGFLLIITGLALSFFQQPVLVLAPSSLGIISLAYYFWRFHRWSTSAAQSQERENIQKTYQEHFGNPLRDVAELKARLETIQETHIKAEQIQKDMERLENQKKTLSNHIQSQFQDLIGEEVDEEDWQKEVTILREKAKELDEEIKDLELESRALGIAESEYRPQPAEEPYQERKLEDLKKRREEIKSDIQAAEDKHNNLKQSICTWTGDDINIPWHTALEHLQDEYRRLREDYKQLTAEIVAKIGVTQVLEQVREQEDEKIRQSLRSKEVIEVLESVTEVYQSLDLTGEQVLVKGTYGDYPLRELSTGAQEQILLALRMGFASRLGGGQPLFMILDDAFQHSDWQRRERLVKKVIHLAKNDWQVIYLTMDDHLRDLFREAGEKIFPKHFTFHELK